AGLAPLKNKKKEGGRAGAINRPPLRGLSQLAGGEDGGRTSSGQALDSLDFQAISQFTIRLTEIWSEKIWVMTSVETLGYYHASLRDEHEVLAVLDEAVPAPVATGQGGSTWAWRSPRHRRRNWSR